MVHGLLFHAIFCNNVVLPQAEVLNEEWNKYQNKQQQETQENPKKECVDNLSRMFLSFLFLGHETLLLLISCLLLRDFEARKTPHMFLQGLKV